MHLSAANVSSQIVVKAAKNMSCMNLPLPQSKLYYLCSQHILTLKPFLELASASYLIQYDLLSSVCFVFPVW